MGQYARSIDRIRRVHSYIHTCSDSRPLVVIGVMVTHDSRAKRALHRAALSRRKHACVKIVYAIGVMDASLSSLDFEHLAGENKTFGDLALLWNASEGDRGIVGKRLLGSTTPWNSTEMGSMQLFLERQTWMHS